MIKTDLLNLHKEIKAKSPIVFHITNTVTINDCANITLSMGGSPLMSFCKDELEEILSFSSALVINIGTMEDSMRSMVVEAGKIANKLGVPVVLDPVGAGASTARRSLTNDLVKNVKFAVIKGNMAEINTIAGFENSSNRGVDSTEHQENAKDIAKNLALKLNSVIAITGKDDIISNGEKTYVLSNGTPLLGKVTGTGCMTASLIGCGCGASSDYLLSAILGVSTMSLVGEIITKALPSIGNGSLKVKILDFVSNLTDDAYSKNLNIQEV